MMTRRNAYRKADEAFYNEHQIPDKMLYIKRIMDGCETLTQFASAYVWGHKVIENLANMISRKFGHNHELCDIIYFDGKLNRNVDSVQKELAKYYLDNKKKWEQ